MASLLLLIKSSKRNCSKQLCFSPSFKLSYSFLWFFEFLEEHTPKCTEIIGFYVCFPCQHVQDTRSGMGHHRDWGLYREDCTVWQGHTGPWSLICSHSSPIYHPAHCLSRPKATATVFYEACSVSRDTGSPLQQPQISRDGTRDRGCRHANATREIRNEEDNLVRKMMHLFSIMTRNIWPYILNLLDSIFFPDFFWQQISET